MKATKFIIGFLTALLFNIVAGTAIAGAAGLDPFAVVGAGIVLSTLWKPVTGALPMAVSITTAYAGEVLEQLLVRATTGNQLVAGGHIRVQPNVQKKFSIPF